MEKVICPYTNNGKQQTCVHPRCIRKSGCECRLNKNKDAHVLLIENKALERFFK